MFIKNILWIMGYKICWRILIYKVLKKNRRNAGSCEYR